MKEKSVCEIDYGGNKYWRLNGLLHREEDLPAVEHNTGTKIWCINNNLHRENGPAVEYFDGGKEWYLNGKKIDCKTQEEFEYYMKWKIFL